MVTGVNIISLFATEENEEGTVFSFYVWAMLAEHRKVLFGQLDTLEARHMKLG